MQRLIPMTAIALVLAAGSTSSADARQARSYVHAAGCSARLMGSDGQDARGLCATPVAQRKRVRVGRWDQSRRAHVVRRGSGAGCGGSLSAVRAQSGAVACVASHAAAKFQAFVTALEATGYRIDFMGGWRRHGSCRGCNMHPRGLAIDINQTGRNRVTRRFPTGVTALAEQNGLLHGAVWQHADAGHFELLTTSNAHYARRPPAYASAERAMHRYVRRRTSALAAPGATMYAESAFDVHGNHYR
jgi:hypothetical protein